jgi:tripartite-type tricarboxylate transporter receptor subunit TctC
MSKTLAKLFLFLACGVLAGPAACQQWPDKPVRILVPFPPGGGTDIQARLLSSVFQKSMGQNFIIDNRTGAGGLIAGQLAVDSPPDGNTILFTSGSISVVVTLYAKRIKFDPLTDLAPISWLSSTPLVLSVHPSVPAKNVRELIALTKNKPGLLNGGGNTAGSTSHLTAEMLNQVAGIKSQVITYRGGGPAVIALISGEIDYIFATAPSIMPHLKSGKARALAVTTPKRSSALPDLPTMNSIYPGFESDNWYAMFFPKGTPKAIVDKMNAEIKNALKSDEVRKFMQHEALDAVASSPEELTALFKRDIEKYAKVIKFANVRLD